MGKKWEQEMEKCATAVIEGLLTKCKNHGLSNNKDLLLSLLLIKERTGKNYRKLFKVK